MLHNRFECAANPYEEALRLMYNCLDFKNAKPKSLAFLIMDEFKVWSSDKCHIKSLLTHDLKLSAFNVVRQQNLFSVMKLVAKVYEFQKDSDIFLNIIRHMIRNKDYKEVGFYIRSRDALLISYPMIKGLSNGCSLEFTQYVWY